MFSGNRVLFLPVALGAFSCLAIGQVPASQPDEAAAQFAAEQREGLAQLTTQGVTVAPVPIETLIHLDTVNGDIALLQPDTHGKDELNFPVDTDGSSEFHLTINHLNVQPPDDAVIAHLMRFDAANSRALNVDLSRAAGRFNLTVVLQMLDGTTEAQLVCQTANNDDPAAAPLTRLYMSRDETPNGTGDAHSNVAESNFATLVRRHHDEALAMLGEGLTAMRAMHLLAGVGQDEARAIFASSRPVEPAADHELDVILAELREHGSPALPELRERLRRLGPPAAAALQRRPRQGWSVDLSLNVDTLTADLLRGDEEVAAALLASPTRLVDLLYSPDVAVRRGALEKLLTGTTEKIAIDADGDPYARVAQIEAARSRLTKRQ